VKQARFKKPRIVAAALLLLAPAASTCAHASAPLSRAYSFLYRQMDRYSQGGSLRLVQSYVPTSTFSNGDLSYTYDNDVLVLALLRRGQAEDVARARILGDTLLYVQARDPHGDWRVRSVYHAKALRARDGSLRIANAASYTGDLAWTGIALAQLYNATGKRAYLSGALALADFVRRSTYDTRGAGGFTGGTGADGKKIVYKSTEHNIDLYALFTLLAELTGQRDWAAYAQHALTFVQAMWNGGQGYFQIGTGNDGTTVNKANPTPEDVQSWSFLAMGLARYQGSIDWALANLSATSGSFRGLSFEVEDRSGVWFEGTAHAAAALETRNLPGDAQAGAQLLSDIEAGQARAPNADGYGIDAASKDGLDTADGVDKYYASPHIATTAWYCLAKQSANPFRLLTPVVSR
jgi:hypothetical protein